MRAAIIIAVVVALLLLWAVLYAQPISVPSPGPQWFPHGIRCPAGVPCGTSTATVAGMGGNAANSPGSDGIYNVKNYGATGNGSTDDVTAIQSALNAAASTKGQVYLPAATYKHTYPLRIAGDYMQVFGAGINNTKLTQNYLGSAIIVNGTGHNVLTYGSALVGTGNSLDLTNTTTAWMVPSEAVFNPAIGGLIGKSAFDVEFWYKTPAAFPAGATSYLLSSINSNPAGVSPDYSWKVYTTNASRVLNASFNLSGGAVTITSAALSTSTAYDIAIDYDGSTCRLFLNGAVAASGACSGTLLESSFGTISVPDSQILNWPNVGRQGDTWLPGFIDAIHISKISRHTGAYTPATSKPIADANSLLVENFATTAVDGTQIATTGAAAGGVSTIYLTVYGSAQDGVGVHLHDMEVCNGNTPADGVTVFGWGGEYDHLSCGDAGFYGFAFPPGGVGNFYENVHDNSVAAANPVNVTHGNVGYFYGNNFTEGHIANNQIGSAGIVGSVNYGNATDENSNFIASSPMIYPFMAMGQVLYRMPFDDLESADPQMLAAMFISDNSAYPPVIIDGGQFLTVDAVPIFKVNGGTPPILNGVQDYVIVGVPSMVANFLSAPASALTIRGFSGLPTIPLSNMDQWITTSGCGGPVTLATGAGTFSNVCVTAASICSAIDVTTFSNAVTLAAPVATTGPTAGHVDITGTGSDVVKVACQ